MPTASDKKVNVLLSVNLAQFSSNIDQANRKLGSINGAMKGVQHQSVSSMQATSGALRLMEGGITNNLRAAERFVSMLPGVGAAMKLAFPVVGLIAVGAIIVRSISELGDFIKKTKEAGKEFHASLQEMTNASRLNNDELERSNLELENQIAKLTGRRQNVLASQLLDARLEADKLAQSAAVAAKQMQDLLEKNKAGVLARIMGSGSTSDVFGNIKNFSNLKSQAEQDLSDALHNGDQKGADAAKQRYQQYLANERAYLQQQQKLRSGYVKYAQTPNGPALVEANQNDLGATTYGKSQGDQTRNLEAIRGALSLNYDQRDRIDLDAQHTKDTGVLKTAQDNKSLAEKAAAAQRKADEDHLRALQEQFQLIKTSMPRNPWETDTNYEQRQRLAESNFFGQHLRDFRKSTPEYKEMLTRTQQPLLEYNNTDAKGREALKNMLADQGSTEGIFAGLGTDKDTQGRLKAQQEAISAQAELSNKLRETSVSQDLADGSISKYDAAVQMATLHTAAYHLQLENLHAEARQIASDPTLNEETRRSKMLGLGAQIGALGQNYDFQHANDQDAIREQTGLGGWKESLDQFVQQSRDTATQVRDIWSNALTSVNEEIVKVISTRHNYGLRQEFGNIGAGIFRSIAGSALNKAEGSLLGGLGFGGKADGSSSKPFHVILAGASGAASAAGGALSKVASGAGGILGKLGGFFTGLGFADGGHPPVGMASMVGERGPELFVPRTAGTIIPNHMMGGGSISHSFHIDARGATDPAAVNAAVQRGIAKALPDITAASMQAQRESASRKPSSRR